MKKLDDVRINLKGKEYVPIMIGGMGVDISTPEMALAGAKQGGIAHMSDALILSVSDRYFKTEYAKERSLKYKELRGHEDKSLFQFDVESIKKATELLVSKTMEKKQGDGGVYVNLMEKLTMNNPKETLQARLRGALDGGIDGVSLGAGLNLGTFELIKDHPRFNDVALGIIVSSARALKLFLKRSAKLNRHPDFVVVEGPLAGGHLGFGIEDWHTYDLKTIMLDVIALLNKEGLEIPVIPAGGIFTGTDGVELIEQGASAVQVATRFTIARESGLPDEAKQFYFAAEEDDIEVNLVSPTGYPMRMLKQSPCIGAGNKPSCENMGYILDRNGQCSYIKAYDEAAAKGGEKVVVSEKTCLCTQMKSYKTWTCGHKTYRLKETTNQLANGIYQQPTVEEIFNDYRYSTDHQIIKPVLPPEMQSIAV